MDVAIVGCNKNCVNPPNNCTYRKFAKCGYDVIQIPIKSASDLEMLHDVRENVINDKSVGTIVHADCLCEREEEVKCKLTTIVRIESAHGGFNELKCLPNISEFKASGYIS